MWLNKSTGIYYLVSMENTSRENGETIEMEFASIARHVSHV